MPFRRFPRMAFRTPDARYKLEKVLKGSSQECLGASRANTLCGSAFRILEFLKGVRNSKGHSRTKSKGHSKGRSDSVKESGKIRIGVFRHFMIEGGQEGSYRTIRSSNHSDQ